MVNSLGQGWLRRLTPLECMELWARRFKTKGRRDWLSVSLSPGCLDDHAAAAYVSQQIVFFG